MKLHISSLGSLALLTLVAGCVDMAPPPEPPPKTVEYRLPVLTPVEPDKQTVERDGIRVSAAGYTYTPQYVRRSIYRSTPAIIVSNDQYPALMRTFSRIEVRPKDVRFKVKIDNELERVLRLAGAVVSFQVAGKSMAVDKSRYDDFLGGIILPRQEGEYEIAGPDLSAVPDNATIALFLYDIVTATDAAGNPTKRSNFEFFFTLSREAKSEVLSAATKQIYLKPYQANLLRQREMASPGNWVAMPEFDRLPELQ